MRWARIALGVAFSLFGLLVVSVLGLYASAPSAYAFTRSRTIAAPRSTVLAHLSDLRAFEAWDPWPAAPGQTPTVTFSPVTSGTGAWVDREDPYGGARTTLTAVSSDGVEMTNATHGTFTHGASTQRFALVDAAGGTEVRWTLSSDLSGVARLLWPFLHIEEHAGADMDAALSRLDRACQ